MNFITIDDLNKCIYRNLKKLPRDIDLVVGIPRSGTIVGGLIALYLNLPYTDIDNYLQRGDFQGGGNTRRLASWIRSIGDAQKVLVVDDSISSGRAMREARQRIRKSRISIQKNKKTEALCGSLLFLASTSAMKLFSQIPNITVDYPSRSFQHGFLNFLKKNFLTFERNYWQNI